MWTRPSYVFFCCTLAACRPEARQPEPTPSSVPAHSSANSRPAKPPEPVPVLLASAENAVATLPSAEPLASAPRHARRVVVMGDSLSDPRVHGGRYLEPLAACPSVVIDNYAKGGFMVNQMRRRFESEVLPALRDEVARLGRG